MKVIAVSDDIYQKLLEKKHDIESELGRPVSFSDTVASLFEKPLGASEETEQKPVEKTESVQANQTSEGETDVEEKN